MSPAERVWNRACDGAGGDFPGDRALRTLIVAHGYVMNSGILHFATDTEADELKEAIEAYRYFGLEDVIALIEKARAVPEHHRDAMEAELDRQYLSLNSDELLMKRFTARHASDPGAYAPVQE